MRRLGFVIAIVMYLFMPMGFTQMHNSFSYNDYKPSIQYSTKLWNCHTFGDLIIYYFGDGNEMASMVAWYTNQQLELLSQKIGIRYQGLLHVLVYGNADAFLSSNIGSAANHSQGQGWNHEVALDRIVVVNTGNLYDCQRQIRKELAKLLLNVYFNGSTLKSQLVNQTLINLPAWFIDGIADYLAGSVNNFQKARFGLLLAQEPINYNFLTAEEWKTLGFFLFRYIEHAYDPEQWIAIISLTRATQSAEDAISIVIGQSFHGLLKECFSHFRQQFGVVTEHGKDKTTSLGRFIPKESASVPVVSNSGRYFATASYRTSHLRVLLTDTLNRHNTKILEVPNLGNEQSISNDELLMRWSPIMDNLIIIVRTSGQLMLYQYDVPSGHMRKRTFDYFETINGFSVSPDGSRLVLSAVKDGLTDIFTVTLASMHIERLTKDVFDDLDPVFVSNNQVVFSSNRTTTLVFPSFVEVTKTLRSQMDLFILSLATAKPAKHAVQLTFTGFQSEIGVEPLNDSAFFFLAQSEIKTQACLGILDSTLISFDTLAHYQQFMRAYTLDKTSGFISKQHFASAYKVLISMMGNGHFSYNYLNQMQFSGYQTNAAQTYGSLIAENDTMPIVLQSNGFANYQFSQEALQKTGFSDFKMADKSLPQSKDLQRFRLKGLIPYSPQFFIRKISSAIDFNAYNYAYQLINNAQNPEYQVPGFNILTQGGCSDLTEDHHIDFGVRISADLVNNEYLLRYRNLKHRLDQEYTFYYRTLQQPVSDGIFYLRDYFVGSKVTWPITPYAHFWGKLGVNYSLQDAKAVDESNLKKPTQSDIRPEVALAFEHNSQHHLFLNLRKGLAYRVFAEAFYTSRFNCFIYSMGYDFRFYTRIGRSVFMAIRTAAGTSGSAGKLLFVLGGLHNQLNAEYNNQLPVGMQSNYLYQAHNAGLRGYKVGVRQGSSYALSSAEVRMPIIRMLVQNPLRSAFLKNLQVVGFADAGTAWSGWSPFSDDNELYVRYVNNGPIAVKVYERHQPIVASAGFGIRALIIGYFMKIDYAWPIFDGLVHQPALQVSMGLDF